jgi:TolB-like protein
MQDNLIKIKRLIISNQYIFTKKAELEMFADSLTEEDVLESIVNANGIKKVIRSTSSHASGNEKLYIIESFTYDGILVYTMGSIKRLEGKEYFYLLISSKKAIKN